MTDPVLYNHEYPRRVRLAVIGCGGHAVRNVLPTFVYAPVDLVALCDLDRAKAEHYGRLFGAGSMYSDYRGMLREQQPEAVIAITSYDDHGRPRYPEIAQECMTAGAHVWIEKPPAASAEQVRQMMRTSRQTGRFVMVGFKKMFFPAHEKAKQIIADPAFGALSSLTARYPMPLPPLEERGDDRRMRDFLDHIVHPWSLLHYLAGPARSIYVSRAGNGGSVTAIRFANGAVGALHLPWRPGVKAPLERTEAVGDGASLIIDNGIRLTYYRAGESDGGYGRTGSYYGREDVAPLTWEPEFSLGQLYNKGIFTLGYVNEVQTFCRCVLENRPPQVAGLDDALHLMKIYEAYRLPEGREHEIATEPT
jgi:predicted dehydrogenase